MEDYNFIIFDDMNEYFLKISKFEEKWNIQMDLTMIENENSCNQFLQ